MLFHVGFKLRKKIMMCEVCRAADMEKTAALTSGSQQDCRENPKWH